MATACLQGEQAQHGRPIPAVEVTEPGLRRAIGVAKAAASVGQPEAREGQAGPGWESDGPIVPRKRVTTVEGRGLS